MKGIFPRACTPEQRDRYCGKSVNGDFQPGILRFHGGYPTDTSWTEDLYQFCVSLRFIRPQAKAWGYTNQACLHRLRTAHFHKETVLVDIVHPQQNWQVKSNDTNNKDAGAFIEISLYQPELRFGISSNKILEDTEWKIIWKSIKP
jgi:CRISPR-associated protein Cmr6